MKNHASRTHRTDLSARIAYLKLLSGCPSLPFHNNKFTSIHSLKDLPTAGSDSINAQIIAGLLTSLPRMSEATRYRNCIGDSDKKVWNSGPYFESSKSSKYNGE